MTPPPTNTTLPGRSRSLNISSEVIIKSAPGIGSGRAREPVAMTMCFASMMRSPTLTVLQSTNLALSRKTSTPRSASVSASRSGMPSIIAFSRSISLRPVEARLRHGDAMHMRLPDLVQRVAGGDQHLLRRAAAIGAGAAEIAILGERDLEPRLPRRHGDAEAGIAAAKDQDVIAIGCHDRA